MSPNTTFSLFGYSKYIDNQLEFEIVNMSMETEPFKLKFNGVSDFSKIYSRFVVFLSNLIRDRIQSFSNHKRYLPKINSIVNGFVDVIPDEFEIPETNLYLEGGLSKNFKIKKNKYIMMPFDISLQNTNHPYTQNNEAVFKDFVEEDYFY